MKGGSMLSEGVCLSPDVTASMDPYLHVSPTVADDISPQSYLHPARGSSPQVCLDSWLQQVQSGPNSGGGDAAGSCLNLDGIFDDMEFDLDFLTELSSLRASGDDVSAAASLLELGADTDLISLFSGSPSTPSGVRASPVPAASAGSVDVGMLESSPTAAMSAPVSTAGPPTPAATVATTSHACECDATCSHAPASVDPSQSTKTSTVTVSAPGGSTPSQSRPHVASISIVANKKLNRTIITIRTAKGQQSFLLMTADLTRASRVLKALQKKRRRSDLSEFPAAVSSPLSLSNNGSISDGTESLAEFDVNATDGFLASGSLDLVGVDMAELYPVGGSASSDPQQTSERPRRRRVQLFYRCPRPDCAQTFARLSQLKRHLLTHAQYRPYVCTHSGCSASFYDRFKLNRHLLQHGEARYQCETCGAGFKQRGNMQRHMANVHISDSTGSARCVLCSRTLSTAAELYVHMQSAHPGLNPDKPFRCDVCERTFAQSRQLRVHQSSHRTTPLRCDHPDCTFTALRTNELTVHRRQHAFKPFKCMHPNCGWSFLTLAKLKRHECQHTERRRFVCPCPGCGKSYRRLEYLAQHVHKHGDSRSYRCPSAGCESSFIAAAALVSHMRQQHNFPSRQHIQRSQFKYVCDVCGARFQADDHRRAHCQIVHEIDAVGSDGVDVGVSQDGESLKRHHWTPPSAPSLSSSASADGGKTGRVESADGNKAGRLGSAGDKTGRVGSADDKTGRVGSADDKTGRVGSADDKTGRVGSADDKTGRVGSADDKTGRVGSSGDKTGRVGSADDKNGRLGSADDKTGRVGSADDKTGRVGSADDKTGCVGSADDKTGRVVSADDKTGRVGSADDKTGRVGSADDKTGRLGSADDKTGRVGRGAVRFNPSTLEWVEADDSSTGTASQSTDPAPGSDRVPLPPKTTLTLYVPVSVPTDSGQQDLMVRCQMSEDECRSMDIELGVLSDHAALLTSVADGGGKLSSRLVGRRLTAMGVGRMPQCLRRVGSSGCARTDLAYQSVSAAQRHCPTAATRSAVRGHVMPLSTPTGLVSSSSRRRRRNQQQLTNKTAGRHRVVVNKSTSVGGDVRGAMGGVLQPALSNRSTQRLQQVSPATTAAALTGIPALEQMFHVESSALMDPLSLLGDDFRPLGEDLVQSTINLDDLA